MGVDDYQYLIEGWYFRHEMKQLSPSVYSQVVHLEKAQSEIVYATVEC